MTVAIESAVLWPQTLTEQDRMSDLSRTVIGRVGIGYSYPSDVESGAIVLGRPDAIEHAAHAWDYAIDNPDIFKGLWIPKVSNEKNADPIDLETWKINPTDETALIPIRILHLMTHALDEYRSDIECRLRIDNLSTPDGMKAMTCHSLSDAIFEMRTRRTKIVDGYTLAAFINDTNVTK